MIAFLANKELVFSESIKVFLEDHFGKPENLLPIGNPGSPNNNVAEIIRLINDPCSGVIYYLVLDILYHLVNDENKTTKNVFKIIISRED